MAFAISITFYMRLGEVTCLSSLDFSPHKCSLRFPFGTYSYTSIGTSVFRQHP